MNKQSYVSNDKQRIEGSFDGLASKWNVRYRKSAFLKTPTLMIRLRNTLKLFKKHAGISKKVADIGCGSGDMLAALAQQGEKNLVGCDLSQEMITMAQASVPEAKFFVADMDQLNAIREVQGCDVLILLGVLSYYPDPLAKLKQVKEILADDGLIIFSHQNLESPFQKMNIRRIKNPNHHSFSPDIFNNLDGMSVIERKYFCFYKEPYRMWRIPFFSVILYYFDALIAMIVPKKYGTGVLVVARKKTSDDPNC